MREQKPAARILIADDHQLLADACKSLLEPEFEVVAIVADGRCLMTLASALNPDIIILDIYMPHLNGLDAGEQIHYKMPRVKLVFLTMTMAADVAAEAFAVALLPTCLNSQLAMNSCLLSVRSNKVHPISRR